MNLLEKLLLGGGLLVRSVRRLVLAFAVVILLHLFVMTIIIVDGHSMDPTLANREVITINKIVRMSALKRGDIVVFHDLSYPGRNFVKRVVGLPGETIQIKNGGLFVDGVQLEEAYLPLGVQTNASEYGYVTTNEIKVPEGEYFLSGDNRENSNDSRAFGPVEQRFIVGTAMFSVYPTFEVYTRPYYSPVHRETKPSPSPSPQG